MKVKYYMRGIGIGIILSIIIWSVGTKKMSDTDIIEAAKQLGMVEAKEDDLNLDALKKDPLPTVTPSIEAGPTIEPNPSIEAGPTIEPNPSIEAGPTIEPNPSIEPSIEATPSITATISPTPTVAPTEVLEPIIAPTEAVTPVPTPTSDEKGQISFEIKSGMYSEEISKMLKEHGLIDDWEDFNKYLVSNGYASSIRTNKYQIHEGASYYEIADLITKRPQ